MPYMDGLETIEKIRRNFDGEKSSIPIFLLHSSADDDYIHKKCKELHVENKISKPIKLKDLFYSLGQLNPRKQTPKPKHIKQASNSSSEKYKVLIAEDNSINMFLAKTIIMKIAPQTEILEAANGLEALKLTKTHHPDLILMDIQMPVMSGHEATMKIKNDPELAAIPIVAITAGNVKGEREKCIESGMVDFVPKPIIEKSIQTVFDKWLKNQNRLEENTIQGHSSSANNHIDHFNVEKVKEYLGDEPEVIREVLKLTLVELDNSLRAIKDKVIKKDPIGLSTEGHKLKGSALTAGLHKLFEISVDLEELNGYDETFISSLMEKLESEKNTVSQLIKDYIAED